jgi:ferrous iron transport protein B
MSGCGECNACPKSKECTIKNADYTIALAGNANVGKSVIFNQLTGVDQIIGNWPGKTVERAEGLLLHRGKRIRVIDLPGIYSFSTYSMEELVSRDFIALEHPDAVINVIDASALERNLFFTIQLLELAPPLLIAINQIDLAEKKGIIIDTKKLSGLLGVPVVPTVAIRGKGIADLTEAITGLMQDHPVPPVLFYGKEIEERIGKITSGLIKVTTPYPVRWTAIKLLERDPAIMQMVANRTRSS